jgi:hypothetical protein
MEAEKVNEVLAVYAVLLSESGYPAERQEGENDVSRLSTLQLRHAHWMCNEARAFPADKVKKKMRWLGFIQGVLWANGFRTIEEMRRDNMPSNQFCTQCGEKLVAYAGAKYCGAACSAKAEAGEPPAEP